MIPRIENSLRTKSPSLMHIGEFMTISISNSTVNNNVPAGTVIGVLTAYDVSSKVIPCNFTLTKNSAGFFAISGNSLVTERALILAGIYSVRVHASGTTTRFSGNAVFHVAVRAP